MTLRGIYETVDKETSYETATTTITDLIHQGS